MTLRPSRSTLFPYTTLFRSVFHRVTPPIEDGVRPNFSGDLLRRTTCQRILGAVHRNRLLCRLPWRSDHRFEPEYQNLDRKSTRLNSSHTVSSYAVFCLKKKK